MKINSINDRILINSKLAVDKQGRLHVLLKNVKAPKKRCKI